MVSAAPGYVQKFQPAIEASLGASYLFLDTIGPALSLHASNVWPSDPQGGFLYRGYLELGISAAVMAQWKAAVIDGIGDFRVGGSAGMGGTISNYQYTTLAFFLPSIDMSAFVSWSPSLLPMFDFTLSVPARIILRRDMSYSFSFGVTVGASFIPWRAPQ